MKKPRNTAPSSVGNTSEKSKRKLKKPQKRIDKEIRKQRRSVKLCIPKLPFSRLVRAIQLRISTEIKYWQSSAIACLHEAAEAFLVQLFEDAYSISQVSGRVTLMRRDLNCVERIYWRNGLVRGQES